MPAVHHIRAASMTTTMSRRNSPSDSSGPPKTRRRGRFWITPMGRATTVEALLRLSSEASTESTPSSPTRFMSDHAFTTSTASTTTSRRYLRAESHCKVVNRCFTLMVALWVSVIQSVPRQEVVIVLVRYGRVVTRVVPATQNRFENSFRFLQRLPMVFVDAAAVTASETELLLSSNIQQYALATPTLHRDAKAGFFHNQATFQPTLIKYTPANEYCRHDYDDYDVKTFPQHIDYNRYGRESDPWRRVHNDLSSFESGSQASYGNENLTNNNSILWLLLCNLVLTTTIILLSHWYQRSIESNKRRTSLEDAVASSSSSQSTDASTTAVISYCAEASCCCCCSSNLESTANTLEGLSTLPSAPPSSLLLGTSTSSSSPNKLRLKDLLRQSSWHNRHHRVVLDSRVNNHTCCADDVDELVVTSEPIADLFPQTTVMFANISGFTAWSSEREPAQVFMLLESLCRAFDEVANQMGVLLLDTIGDCYIAVAANSFSESVVMEEDDDSDDQEGEGVDDHALLMVRFALECRKRMTSVTRHLEVVLGPDTADLAMRFGIHSGPVTAGVLRRGQPPQARLQLLGDTVNVAARMEHSGLQDCIQLSQDSADFLVASGKSDWITPRQDPITIQGRGNIQTYWLKDNVMNDDTQSTSLSLPSTEALEHSVSPQEILCRPGRGRTPRDFLLLSRDNSLRIEEGVDETATAASSCSNSKTTVVSDESQRWGTCVGWDESVRCERSSSRAHCLPSSDESQRWEDEPIVVTNPLNINKDLTTISTAFTLSTIQNSDREQRWITWNTKVLLRHLTKVVIQRYAAQDSMPLLDFSEDSQGSNQIGGLLPSRSDVFSEVAETIGMPRLQSRLEGTRKAHLVVETDKEVEVPMTVQTQLREFVIRIASMYRENPFHNFEHASHVTMSVNKLLKRIVTPDHVFFGPWPEFSTNNTDAISGTQDWDMKWELHDSTFGIASDALTQFAVVFAALIHDVDHEGVPNAQLVKERSWVSTMYKGRSVAEQNSVDVAWMILMEPCFDELRSCICSTEADRKRFRQLVVNCVLATDIGDEELQSLRKRRWERAFDQKDVELAESTGKSAVVAENMDRKATIVIEHLIQASDVAHTMQHWHIYVKWNERLFQEMYGAYLAGRADKDPSIGWYQGELSFFDNYIIPLARKLKECGVFGVSGDEYLNYALDNRMEWKRKGQGICKEWKEKFVHKLRV